jgi:hypothetical protein
MIFTEYLKVYIPDGPALKMCGGEKVEEERVLLEGKAPPISLSGQVKH